MDVKCFICGTDAKSTLQEHHIVPRRYGGSDRDENLVTLCASCHQAIEKIYDDRFYEMLGAKKTTPKSSSVIEYSIINDLNEIEDEDIVYEPGENRFYRVEIKYEVMRSIDYEPPVAEFHEITTEATDGFRITASTLSELKRLYTDSSDPQVSFYKVSVGAGVNEYDVIMNQKRLNPSLPGR